MLGVVCAYVAWIAVLEVLKLRLPYRVMPGLTMAILLELTPRRWRADVWADVGIRVFVVTAAAFAILELLRTGR